MARPIPQNSGSIFETALMRHPDGGSHIYALPLDFSADGSLFGDLFEQLSSGQFDTLQSVYIDNSANAASFTLTFSGVGTRGYSVVAQPFTQGWYPVAIPHGNARFTAVTTQGQVIPLLFSTMAMPYFVWGPTSGVILTPSLTPGTIDKLTIAGDDAIVAGIAATNIRLYRLIISVDAPTNVRFYSGPSAGAVLLGGGLLTAGGSMTLQATGIPWFTCATAAALTMKCSAAVNMLGSYGYTQV